MAAAVPTGAAPADSDMPDAGVWEHVEGDVPPADSTDATSGGAGNPGEALPAGGPVPASSDETALAVVAASSAVRRDADPSWQQGAFPCKRSKRNQPADVPSDVWQAGVDLSPRPGWQELEVWYAPGEAWKVMKVYAHPTATAGDLKWKVQDMVGIAHNSCCLYGVRTEKNCRGPMSCCP